MSVPPCKRFGQDEVRSSQVGGDGKKIFEYLANEALAWITEDQLRVSLSPKMLSELQGNLPSS
jgi:hypothetical protein